MSKGKLYKKCVAPSGQFTHPKTIEEALDEAKAEFPKIEVYYIDQRILKWFKKYFGEKNG